MPVVQDTPKNNDNTSVAISRTTDSAYDATSTDLFKIAEIVEGEGFSLLDGVITKGGVRIIGCVIGNVPTVANGIVKHDARDSSFWEAATDIGIDIALNAIPGASRLLTMSEAAAYLELHQNKYLQLFEAAHTLGDTTFDVSDQMDRYVALGAAEWVSIPSKAVNKLKGFVASHPEEVMYLFGVLPTMLSKLAQRQEKSVSETPDFSPHQTSSGRSGGDKLPSFYLPPNPYLPRATEVFSYQHQATDIPKQTQHGVDDEPASTTDESTDITPVSESLPSTAQVKSVNKMPVSGMPDCPTRPSNWGATTAYVRDIPDGIRVGFEREHNSYGTVGAGLDLTQDTVNGMLDLGKQVFGVRGYDGEYEKYGINYHWRLEKDAGFKCGAATLIAQREGGGPEYRQPVTLDWDWLQLSFAPNNLNKAVNQKRIQESLDKAISEDQHGLTPTRITEFHNDLQQALDSPDFEQAAFLSKDFFKQYQDIPDINKSAAAYQSYIQGREIQHLFNSGQTAADQGNFTTAIDFYRQAQDISADHIDSTIALSELYLKQGNLPAAISEARKIADKDPAFSKWLEDLISYQSAVEKALKSQEAARRTEDLLFILNGSQLAIDLGFDFVLPFLLGDKQIKELEKEIQKIRQGITNLLVFVEHYLKETISAFSITRVISSIIQLASELLLSCCGDSDWLHGIMKVTEAGIYALDCYALASNIHGLFTGNLGLKSVLSLTSQVHLLNPWLSDKADKQFPKEISLNRLRLFLGYFLDNLNKSIPNRYLSVHGVFLLDATTRLFSEESSAKSRLSFGITVLENIIYPIVLAYYALKTMYDLSDIVQFRSIQNTLLRKGIYVNLGETIEDLDLSHYYRTWLEHADKEEIITTDDVDRANGLFRAIAYYTDEDDQQLRELVTKYISKTIQKPDKHSQHSHLPLYNHIVALEHCLGRNIIVCNASIKGEFFKVPKLFETLKKLEQPIFIMFNTETQTYSALLIRGEHFVEKCYRNRLEESIKEKMNALSWQLEKIKQVSGEVSTLIKSIEQENIASEQVQQEYDARIRANEKQILQLEKERNAKKVLPSCESTFFEKAARAKSLIKGLSDQQRYQLKAKVAFWRSQQDGASNSSSDTALIKMSKEVRYV